MYRGSQKKTLTMFSMLHRMANWSFFKKEPLWEPHSLGTVQHRSAIPHVANKLNMCSTLSSLYYKRGSNCVPPTSLQSLYWQCWASRTWSNKCGCLVRLSIASWTHAIRSSSDITGVPYTILFILPQRKLSRGVRSGDRAGHGTGPPIPIQRFGNVTMRWLRTFLSKWVMCMKLSTANLGSAMM